MKLKPAKRLFTSMLLLLLVAAGTGCSGKKEVKPATSLLELANRQQSLAVRHFNNNDYAGAIDYFNKALDKYRTIDRPESIANSYLNLARTTLAQNDIAAARSYLQQAQTVIQREDNSLQQKHLALLQATLALKTGDTGHAISLTQMLLADDDTRIRLAALQIRTGAAFKLNHDDRSDWLQQYKNLQQVTPETESHHARWLRYESALQTIYNEKDSRLKQALQISRQLARSPAIAATLTELAELDHETGNTAAAIDAWQRALFIRHQLGDRRSTLDILKKLQPLYAANNDGREKAAMDWIKKLQDGELSGWKGLMDDFE